MRNNEKGYHIRKTRTDEMRYETVMDLHTHTIASGHAYNTLREMAKAAADRGLEILGITEHAPMMPGTCHNYYFHNLKTVPRELYGIRLFLGAELNILNPQGEVDLNEAELRGMDIGIASLHLPCMKPGTREENTSAYLNAMKNPYVNIIGHPDDGRYMVDMEAVVQAAKEYHTLLELNNNSLNPLCTRQNARENDMEMLRLCKKYQVPIVMGSDAHYYEDILNHELALDVIKETGFPEELVVNTDREKLYPFINKYQKV